MLSDLLINLIHPFTLRINKIELDDLRQRLLSGASLIRWGDGEVTLINGVSISYQSSSEELKRKLLEVILNYDDNLIVASPSMFIEQSLLSLATSKKLKIWFKTRAFYLKYRREMNYSHADAFGFRNESGQLYAPLLKEVCLKKRRVYLLTSSASDLKLVESFLDYNCTVKLIEVPSKNSYESYSSVVNIFKNLNLEDSIFISSAGPLTKAIAMEFVSRNLQLIDLGHFFSHMKVEFKV